MADERLYADSKEGTIRCVTKVDIHPFYCFPSLGESLVYRAGIETSHKARIRDWFLASMKMESDMEDPRKILDQRIPKLIRIRNRDRNDLLTAIQLSIEND